jgi:hypothetical protein
MLPMILSFAATARAAGAITSGQADAWAAEQTTRARDGRLLIAIALYVASANRA